MKPVTGKLRKGGGKGLSGDALVGNVRQSTINDIKRMGMTKALQLAGSNGNTAGGLAREFNEGVRRMYGAKRLATAKAAATPKKGSYQAGSGMAKKGTYTTGSGVSKPAVKKTVTKPASKGMSGTTKRNLIGGALLAGGAIAAKATPAGRAISGAVGLGKAVAGAVGRKTATKALSTSGRAAAAVKRPVSQAQYDAMKKAASAPKKLVKTKAAATGAGAVTMVPKPKKK
jgi:hypothetical protein